MQLPEWKIYRFRKTKGHDWVRRTASNDLLKKGDRHLTTVVPRILVFRLGASPLFFQGRLARVHPLPLPELQNQQCPKSVAVAEMCLLVLVEQLGDRFRAEKSPLQGATI